jgi:long-chain fatty acid transport protein
MWRITDYCAQIVSCWLAPAIRKPYAMVGLGPRFRGKNRVATRFAAAHDGWIGELGAKIATNLLQTREETVCKKERCMQLKNRRTWLAPSLAALPLALAAALVGQNAQASGFQLKENSVQGLGRAFAGEAAAPGDCAVVVNNAAAIGDLGDVNCAQLDINVINFETKFSGSGTDLLGRPLSGGNGGDGGVTKPVPAMYFTHKVNEQWAVGASLGAPFGFETSYDDRSMVRYEAAESKLESLDLTFSTSFKINDQFSIGGRVCARPVVETDCFGSHRHQLPLADRPHAGRRREVPGAVQHPAPARRRVPQPERAGGLRHAVVPDRQLVAHGE